MPKRSLHASSGACLARLHSARRGASLAPWRSVRRRRQAWLRSRRCKTFVDLAVSGGLRLGISGVYNGVLSLLEACSIPIYLSIPVGYIAARGVSCLLPRAHGRCCRLATTVAVVLSTSVVMSAAIGCVAGSVTAALPHSWLWWPKAQEDDGPLRIESKDDVLAWIDRNGPYWKSKLKKLLEDPKRTPQQKRKGNTASLEHWCLALDLGQASARSSRATVVQRILDKLEGIVRRRSSQATQPPAKRVRSGESAEQPVAATPEPARKRSRWNSDAMTAVPASSPAARHPATPERATPERSSARTPRAAEALAMSTRKSEPASPLVAEATPTALRDVPPGLCLRGSRLHRGAL